MLTDAASPLLYRGLLYLVKNGGILASVDPERGEILRQDRITGVEGNFFASPVAADGKLYLVNESGQLAVTGLRMRTNERGELLTTTMPAIEEAAPSAETPIHVGELVFPHVVDRDGYTSQFILFNSTPSQGTVGTVEFYDANGKLIDVTY